jgi:hypothetical protein
MISRPQSLRALTAPCGASAPASRDRWSADGILLPLRSSSPTSRPIAASRHTSTQSPARLRARLRTACSAAGALRPLIGIRASFARVVGRARVRPTSSLCHPVSSPTMTAKRSASHRWTACCSSMRSSSLATPRMCVDGSCGTFGRPGGSSSCNTKDGRRVCGLPSRARLRSHRTWVRPRGSCASVRRRHVRQHLPLAPMRRSLSARCGSQMVWRGASKSSQGS